MSELNGDASASMTETTLPVPAADRDPSGRFAPGHSGNPLGRPLGARSRVMALTENLLEGEMEALCRTVLDKAKSGDFASARFLMEAMMPKRRSRPVEVEFPAVDTLDGVAAAQSSVIAAMGRGEIDPDQAKTIAGVLEQKRKSIESVEFEDRITAMEDHMAKALRFTGQRQR